MKRHRFEEGATLSGKCSISSTRQGNLCYTNHFKFAVYMAISLHSVSYTDVCVYSQFQIKIKSSGFLS